MFELCSHVLKFQAEDVKPWTLVTFSLVLYLSGWFLFFAFRRIINQSIFKCCWKNCIQVIMKILDSYMLLRRCYQAYNMAFCHRWQTYLHVLLYSINILCVTTIVMVCAVVPRYNQDETKSQQTSKYNLQVSNQMLNEIALSLSVVLIILHRQPKQHHH